LRYACHVLLPAPAAVASVWQRLSAPRKPPMFPVVLVELVTKKVMVERTGVGPVLLSLSPHPAAPIRTAASPTNDNAGRKPLMRGNPSTDERSLSDDDQAPRDDCENGSRDSLHVHRSSGRKRGS